MSKRRLRSRLNIPLELPNYLPAPGDLIMCRACQMTFGGGVAAARQHERENPANHPPRPAPPPAYRDDGRTVFCARCQVSLVKGAERQHERNNPMRHPPT